ncbi:MAG: hypothetical protein ABIL76_04615 [candidate division WOR-3 bacterium]
MFLVLSLQALIEGGDKNGKSNNTSTMSASFCSTISIFGTGCGKKKRGRLNLKSSLSLECFVKKK